MPKDILKIDKFEGGQNNSADPRDIAANEQEFLQDVHVDNIGKIRNMGASSKDTSKGEANGTPIPGYGLATYNSGWGFNPASGVAASHTTPTFGTDGVKAFGVLDFSTQNSWYQSQNSTTPEHLMYGGTLVRGSSYDTDGPGSGPCMNINIATDWDCIVLGIFVQKWTTSDSGATYVKAGNPIPLFGTTGSGFKLASENSYATGTLPNGATYTGGKYRMPWNVTTFNPSGSTDGTDYNETYNQESGGVPGTGTAVDYGRNNFLVVCDFDNSNDFTIDNYYSFDFDPLFKSINHINLVYGVGTPQALTDAIIAAINANTGLSGFTAEAISGETGDCNAIKISESSASGACYTFFSNYQRSDDNVNTIADIEDGDDIWNGATTGTNYQAGEFEFWNTSNPDSGLTSSIIIPDCIMIAGMDGHDRTVSGYNSWKGALNWFHYDIDDSYGDYYGDSLTTSIVQELFIPEEDTAFTYASNMGLGLGMPKLAQKEQVVFSGTSASGNAWTIDINGTEHLVSHGDSQSDGSGTVTSVGEWANEFAYDIEAGAQASNVAATTPSTGTLTIESSTAGTAGNFSFSIYPTGTTGVVRVDDERIAYINNAGKLQIHSSNIGGWVNDSNLNNTGWSSPASAKPVMYAEGGALRLSDGNFSSGNYPKVVQYFETGNICGIGSNIIVGHEIMSQDLSWHGNYTISNGSSTTGLIRSANYDDANDFNGTGNDWMNASNLTSQRWKFAFEVSDDEGDWSGKHKFYASAVYADGSESLPSHSFTNTDTTPAASFTDAASTVSTEWNFGENKSLKIRQLCHPDLISDGTWIFDSRMIGIRLWHSKEEDNYSIYYHVGMVHFTDGFLNHSGNIITPWRQSSTVSSLYSCTGTADSTTGATDYTHIISTDEDDTFENRLGYDSSSKALTASYQHATITGRRVFIAGVSYTDESGGSRVYNDRMIASPVNMFDIFPTPYNIIDVDTSDGDVITGLKSAHGRLLQYKSKTMYMINVADSDLQTAFLESTHKYRGVTKPYHIIDIADGVAWANKFGVFKYEGEEVVDLMLSTSDESQRLIDLNEWQSFFSDNSILAYSPLDNLLLIKKDIDESNAAGNSEADVYVYEFNTTSWTTGKERLIKNKDCTNFIVLQDGTLIALGQSTGLDGNPGDPT